MKCLCGCGSEAKKNRKYIHGHNTRGKKLGPHSEERKTKIRNSVLKLYESDEYRLMISKKTKEAMNKPEIKDKFRGKRNQETKKNISRATKIAMNRPEIKKKISRASKKMWNKPGFKQKWSNSESVLKSRNKEWKQKISISRSGKYTESDNHNWNGGVSNRGYCNVWTDSEYYLFIMERDNWKCQNPYCWRTSKNMSRHHIDYNKENCDISNIILLCISCNSRANYNKKYWRRFYKRLRKEIDNDESNRIQTS